MTPRRSFSIASRYPPSALDRFRLARLSGSLAAIVAGEIVWGTVLVGSCFAIRCWARDPSIEIMLSILTPFVAYWPPERLGGTGVLATIAAGLYVSWNGPRLISPATRLQGVFFWDFLTYLIEGMVFLITGLQARTLLPGIRPYSISKLIIAAILVSVVVIVTCFVWMYPAVYLPRWLIPAVRRKDPSPPWQWPFVLAFTGIRGIVSLAAALAIPFTIADGSAFPERDLILFLTFCVILVTLVGEGLTLPSLTRALGLAHCGASRATGRAGRGVQGSKARDRDGDRTARSTGGRAPSPGIRR